MTDQGTGKTPEPRDSARYESPRVERVLTPAQLEREVLYAGLQIQSLDV